MQRLEFRAMGCQMLAVIDSDEPEAAEALEQVPGWFEEWEQALSRFRPDSELNRLNNGAGRPFKVSALLFKVIQHSLAAARATGGIVTPAVLDAVEAAGYDRSFEQIGGGDRQTAPGRAFVGDWKEIRIDAASRTVRLPKGMRLDLGGIAKGWAAGEAAARLGAFGPALVDAGGDIAVSGPMASGAGWPIGIADPHAGGSDLSVVELRGGAVATSGRDYRRWVANGRINHHIIDPRTGLPAETDVLTATVIAPTAVDAEMAAKLALVRGSLPGRRWLDEHPRFAGLLVLEDGSTLLSERMTLYLQSELVAA